MPDSVLDPAFLAFLADSLGQAIADNPAGLLVHVVERADGPDIGILALEGRAPAEALLGTVAPEHWSALGVASTGRAWPLDGGATSRVGVVVLVARDGQVVGRVRAGGEVITEPPGSGLVLDGLQRALGLPTAPPEVPLVHVMAAILLERVLAGDPADLVDDLLGAFEGRAAALDWGRMRQLVVAGEWPGLGLSPEEAAWLDDGAFSRWVTSGYRPLPELRAEVRRLLSPAAARRCDRLLQQLGVDAAA